MGVQNGAVMLGDSLAVSSKALTSSNLSPGYLWVEAYIYAKPCVIMFTTALFKLPKYRKKRRYHSEGEEINCGAPYNGILFGDKKK